MTVMRAWPSSSAARSREAGFTLVELTVAVSIFAALLATTYTVLIAVQRQSAATLTRNDAVDQARLGLQSVDRAVRSADKAFDLTSDPTTLTLLTRADPTSSGSRCMQWQVAAGELRTRSWPVGSTSSAPWRTVARRISNDTTAAQAPFRLETGYGAQVVTVRLLVTGAPGSPPAEVQTSLALRNTDASGAACPPVPA